MTIWLVWLNKTKHTSDAVQANDQISDDRRSFGIGLFSLSNMTSGACQRAVPATVDVVLPVGPTNSSMTWDNPKSLRAAHPSSVIITLDALRSPWTMGGLKVCRYVNPLMMSRIFYIFQLRCCGWARLKSRFTSDTRSVSGFLFKKSLALPLSYHGMIIDGRPHIWYDTPKSVAIFLWSSWHHT